MREKKRSERRLVKRYQEIITLLKEVEGNPSPKRRQEIKDRHRELMAIINTAANRWGSLNNAVNNETIKECDLRYLF